MNEETIFLMILRYPIYISKHKFLFFIFFIPPLCFLASYDEGCTRKLIMLVGEIGPKLFTAERLHMLLNSPIFSWFAVFEVLILEMLLKQLFACFVFCIFLLFLLFPSLQAYILVAAESVDVDVPFYGRLWIKRVSRDLRYFINFKILQHTFKIYKMLDFI